MMMNVNSFITFFKSLYLIPMHWICLYIEWNFSACDDFFFRSHSLCWLCLEFLFFRGWTIQRKFNADSVRISITIVYAFFLWLNFKIIVANPMEINCKGFFFTTLSTLPGWKKKSFFYFIPVTYAKHVARMCYQISYLVAILCMKYVE